MSSSNRTHIQAVIFAGLAATATAVAYIYFNYRRKHLTPVNSPRCRSPAALTRKPVSPSSTKVSQEEEQFVQIQSQSECETATKSENKMTNLLSCSRQSDDGDRLNWSDEVERANEVADLMAEQCRIDDANDTNANDNNEQHNTSSNNTNNSKNNKHNNDKKYHIEREFDPTYQRYKSRSNNHHHRSGYYRGGNNNGYGYNNRHQRHHDMMMMMEDEYHHHMPIGRNGEKKLHEPYFGIRRPYYVNEESFKTGYNYRTERAEIRRVLESPSCISEVELSASEVSSLDLQVSADSGRGDSAGVASSTSPAADIQELLQPLPIYEFEIPQTLVGLVIGVKGKTVKELQDKSNCRMTVRKNHQSARDEYQICTVEGLRENINYCLRLLRKKFPADRFPELNIHPVLPPHPMPASPITTAGACHLPLPCGIDNEVAVSSIGHVTDFWLQQPTHPTFPKLSALYSIMVGVYSHPTCPTVPKPVEVGILCAAPLAEGWFRAQVCLYEEVTDEVVVKFVDYGGYSRMPLSSLRRIRSDFMDLPFQAIECHLANIQPSPNDDENAVDGWSTAAVEYFTSFTGQMLIARRVDNQCDGPFIVELFADVDGQRVDIASKMVEAGHASYISTPSVSPQSDMTDNSD